MITAAAAPAAPASGCGRFVSQGHRSRCRPSCVYIATSHAGTSVTTLLASCLCATPTLINARSVSSASAASAAGPNTSARDGTAVRMTSRDNYQITGITMLTSSKASLTITMFRNPNKGVTNNHGRKGLGRFKNTSGF